MFGFEVVCYLLLGGLGGGLCAVAGAAGLSIPRFFLKGGPLAQYRNPMASSYVLAACSLLLGALFLLAASGNYVALRYLFFAPTWGYLSVGAWAIVLGIGLCLASLLFWRTARANCRVGVAYALHAVGVLAGIAIALYTGLFLASMKAVPFWNTFLLPALFILSSLSCGLVLFVAIVKVHDVSESFHFYIQALLKVDMLVIVLETICAAALLVNAIFFPAIVGSASVTKVFSGILLVAGEHAWVWWIAFVGFGLVAPFFVDAVALRAPRGLPGRLWSTVVPSFCVLVGALALRFCVIAAGMHPVLSL